MSELLINTSFTTIIAGTNMQAPNDMALYLNGNLASVDPTFAQIGTSNNWRVTFTPNATGLYTLYAFGIVQFRYTCVPKLTYTMLANIEDEAVGSWNWNKTTGVLTMYRQNGTLLNTFTVVDNATVASRERS